MNPNAFPIQRQLNVWKCHQKRYGWHLVMGRVQEEPGWPWRVCWSGNPIWSPPGPSHRLAVVPSYPFMHNAPLYPCQNSTRRGHQHEFRHTSSWTPHIQIYTWSVIGPLGCLPAVFSRTHKAKSLRPDTKIENVVAKTIFALSCVLKKLWYQNTDIWVQCNNR